MYFGNIESERNKCHVIQNRATNYILEYMIPKDEH